MVEPIDRNILIVTAGYNPSDTSYVTDLATAIEEIGSEQKTLIIDGPIVISTAITVPSNILLKISNKESRIIKSGSATLTINGPFEAGLYQVFSGFSAGNVTFGSGSVKEAYIQWWQTNTIPKTTDMTLALQAAVASAAKNIRITTGSYLITGTTTLPSTTTITWDPAAVLYAGINNLTFFTNSGLTTAVKLINPALEGNSKSGVVGFDFTWLVFETIIRNARLKFMSKGIHLRSLNNLAIENPYMSYVDIPIVIDGGSNLTYITNPQINHPAVGGVGIDILEGTTNKTTGTYISGGWVQGGGAIGIRDAGIGTTIIGTYFETNTEADISLVSGSEFARIIATSHYAPSSGPVAVKGRNAKSAHITDINVGSGARTTGMYDFDNTNTDCFEYHIQSSNLKNDITELGDMTGLQSDRVVTVGASVASNSTITPTGYVFHVTGANAINTINIPYTNTKFSGSIIIIPDGAYTLGTTGNIAIASTAVVGKLQTLIYDDSTSKWYPSY